MAEMVCIKRFGDRTEAGLVQSMLQENGIQSMISADDAGGMLPDMAITRRGVELMVMRGSADKALTLINEVFG